MSHHDRYYNATYYAPGRDFMGNEQGELDTYREEQPPNPSKFGLCEDKFCDWNDEGPCRLTYHFGVWRCAGCQEDENDRQAFFEANAADFDGWYF